ncbi:hypothetical protein MMC25_000037 [Agyrium rufum]|nr:hypothetical protein [Agyrium rufum]
MNDERIRIINPIVPESVQHNARIVTQIRSLTASLFGIAAGTLGLESYFGFIFYILGTLFVSILIWSISAKGQPSRYFENQFSGLWSKDVITGLSSFVLTWTLFYGLVGS